MAETCIFVNTGGVRCPRIAGEHHVCRAHGCQICGHLTNRSGFCSHHSLIDFHDRSIVPYIDPYGSCEFIYSNGQSCQERSTSDSYFCVLHRCQHGRNTFKHKYHCQNHIVEGQQYCNQHTHTCDSYWTEDDDAMPICVEDVRQCERQCVITFPMRMCAFHYQLYIFDKTPEYTESDEEPDSP